MGLFDSIAGQVAGALGGAGGSRQAELIQVVGGLIANPQTGGLSGLINAFEAKGLGSVVGSWIGTGQNLPISGEQLQSVLGSEQVQAIAQKLGLAPEATAEHLAQVLPHVVDQATPDGTLPEAGALAEVGQLLKGFGG